MVAVLFRSAAATITKAIRARQHAAAKTLPLVWVMHAVADCHRRAESAAVCESRLLSPVKSTDSVRM